ncbi:MAG TPA: autotransporter outer membrane beta-barrel domain-containing protein, partial [Burkholderiales bacterium]|nr:autotransporter outer membrane beta-barrel domain-containing protein [Burkholderiales bacterium]
MTMYFRPALVSSVALLLVIQNGPASAQATPSGIGDLQGLNVPQSAARGSILSACPTLFANFNTLNQPQRDLTNICTAMLQNTAGGSIAQGPGPGFQLGDAQLTQALQTLAHEETAAQGRGSGESPGGVSGAIRSRLFALRGAASTRLSGFQFNGKNVALAETLRNGRGGGAAAEPSGRLGAFVNAAYHTGDREATSREDEFDFDNIGLIAGADYRFRADLIGGAALNYSQTDVDIETAPGGDVETDTYGASLYGTYYRGPFYVDAHANYSRSEYDIERRILIPSNNPGFPAVTRTAKGDPDADQFTLGLGAGYNVPLGALTLTPYGRLEYLYVDIDGYTEKGAVGLDLKVDSESVTSLQSAFGAQLAYAISTPRGIFSPQVYAEWNHEFKNGS